MMSKIVNKSCGNCGKIISVLCSENSIIIDTKCPECKMFDLLKNKCKSSNPSDNNDFKKPCPRCKGKKYIELDQECFSRRTCPECNGQGFSKS